MGSTAPVRPGIKLESAPVPVADTGSEVICYCPECGARLRAIQSEVASKAHRNTLPGLDSLGPFTPGPPPTSDNDEEPTRVFHGLVDATLLNAARSTGGSDALPSAPQNADAGRATAPSTDDEDTDVHRRDELELKQSASSLPIAATPAAATQPPAIQAAPTPAAAAHAGTTPAAATQAAAPQAAPTQVATMEAAGTPAAAPQAQALRAAAVQANTSIPPAVARAITDFDSPYAASARKRKRSVILPVFGLGLGIAAAGGLAFLMYGNTISGGRGNPLTTQDATVKTETGALTTRILAANAAPSVEAESTPSAVAVASAEPPSAPIEQPETKAVAPANTPRRSAEASPGRANATASNKAGSAPDDAESDTASPPTADSRRVPSSSNATAAKATAETAEVDGSEGPKFDSDAAAAALDGAAQRASTCRQSTDPSGVARVTITFAPSGRVTTATISGPPFVGTPTGSCIATIMRSAVVPAFDGSTITVHKTVTIM